MAAPVRTLVATVVALLLLAVVGVVAADDDADERRTDPSAALVRQVRVAVAEHLPFRSEPRTAIAPVILAAMAAIAALTRPDAWLRRGERRLADVGDEWRSLLLGAPPARR